MMRSTLQTRKRCYNHPHRDTELACDRCKTTFCSECLAEEDGAQLCATCRRELEDARAAQLTPRQKAAELGRSFVRGVVVLAVLGVVLAGLFVIYRNYFDRPLTPEELARFRYAMTGTFETEEGINVTSTVIGAKIARVTSDQASHPASSLINEYTGVAAPAWRSTDASFPQEIVVQLDMPSTVEKVILTNSPYEPVESYVRDFEVLVSVEGPDRGFTSAGLYRLEPTSDPQKFAFPSVRAAFVMLRVLGNYGSTAYTSLDEFNAYFVPERSLMRPAGTPDAATPSAR